MISCICFKDLESIDEFVDVQSRAEGFTETETPRLVLGTAGINDDIVRREVIYRFIIMHVVIKERFICLIPARQV